MIDTTIQKFLRTATLTASCAMLAVAVPAEAMCRGPQTCRPCRPTHGAYGPRGGGLYNETKEQAEQRRREERKRMLVKAAVIAAFVVGAGACWYFLGKPSVGYSGRTRVNVAGIPIDLGFGAHHDAPGRRSRGPRWHGHGGHWRY